MLFSPDVRAPLGLISRNQLAEPAVRIELKHLSGQKTAAKSQRAGLKSTDTVPIHILVLQSLGLCTVQDQIQLTPMMKMLKQIGSVTDVSSACASIHTFVSMPRRITH